MLIKIKQMFSDMISRFRTMNTYSVRKTNWYFSWENWDKTAVLPVLPGTAPPVRTGSLESQKSGNSCQLYIVWRLLKWANTSGGLTRSCSGGRINPVICFRKSSSDKSSQIYIDSSKLASPFANFSFWALISAWCTARFLAAAYSSSRVA